jgi:enamine deaminase RidA (YjgF/YER057c/UK114 family)
MSASEKLEKLGFRLDNIQKPAALYRPLVVVGNLAYLSGALPFDGPDRLLYRGKVGHDMTTLDAQGAARLCSANLLRVLHRELGTLDRVQRVVKLTGFVQSAPGFAEQHLVLNGASELMIEVFGEAGKHARSAVGVAELPLGAAVEVEAIFEVFPA